MIEFTVILRAPAGTFQPTSFTEWLGHRVQVTGLDPVYQHVLRAVENTEDGSMSTLTLHTYPEHAGGPDLTAGLSVIHGTPRAVVRAHDTEGNEITTAHLDAPLRIGQVVTVNGALHRVYDEPHWPNRHPDHGAVGAPGDDVEDYQHVTLVPVDEEDVVADLGMPSGPAMPMMGMGVPGLNPMR
jgi:hypothetical protein